MSDASGEAVILSGRQIAKEIREKLAVDVKEIKAKHPEFKPLLTIVQVGGREDSNVYIRMKRRAAEEVGCDSQHVKFPRSITEEEVCIVRLHSNQKLRTASLETGMLGTWSVRATS